jgi:aminoglycoside phosphotransferase (APT) family kinase protein
LQAASVSTVEQLLVAGVPDLRDGMLTQRIAEIVERFGADDPELRLLVEGLPDRLATIASYGLPDALVHGDLHPGNAHSGDGQPVIIDWGDSFIGNPAFDVLRLTQTLADSDARPIVEQWDARWQADVPGSEPIQALDLLRPVAALRLAVVYASFLDGIEPSEHPYHMADVPMSLDAAKRSAATESTASAAAVIGAAAADH